MLLHPLLDVALGDLRQPPVLKGIFEVPEGSVFEPFANGRDDHFQTGVFACPDEVPVAEGVGTQVYFAVYADEGTARL